jgi:hypothetical protein
MPLIQCPECKTEISDKAPSCIKCGHPMAVSAPVGIPAPASVPAPIESKKKVGMVRRLLGLAVLLAVLFYGVKAFNHVNKPAMPVEVKYRRAFLSNGYVTDFKNTSNRQLSILATFSNPTLKTTKTLNLILSPGETKEIGHLEGWNFSSGDTMTLAHHDYQSATWNLP